MRNKSNVMFWYKKPLKKYSSSVQSTQPTWTWGLFNKAYRYISAPKGNYLLLTTLPEDPAFSTGGRLVFNCRYLCMLVSNNLV